MKLRSALICLAAAGCLVGSSLGSTVGSSYTGHPGKAIHPKPAIQPHDSVLYDNGPDDGVNAYTINSGFEVSNSFDLAASFDLEFRFVQQLVLPRHRPWNRGKLGDH